MPGWWKDSRKAPLNGARMGLITKAGHPTSAVQGGCVATQHQWNPGEAGKPSKATFGKSLTVQILTEQSNRAFAPFII